MIQVGQQSRLKLTIHVTTLRIQVLTLSAVRTLEEQMI